MGGRTMEVASLLELVNNLIYIFFCSILIFILGAMISLAYQKKPSVSNIVSNVMSIAASTVGAVFSITKIVFFSKEVLNFKLYTNVAPFNIVFYIDNLSAFFILTISALALIVSIYSIGYVSQFYGKRNVGYLGFLYNLFIVSMLLVVTCGQVFYFVIVWELMSLISFFLVVYENEKKETQRAGIVYIIMTHCGTAFIIAAFVLIFIFSGTADFSSVDPTKIPNIIKSLIFIFSLIGFGTKAGIIPLHIWLPYAHPASPSNVSALMSGVMIKTAVFWLIRIVMCTLGPEYKWWGELILIIGVLSTILGVAFALVELDIKKLLAYSSIENIGIIFIGLGLSIMAKASGNTLIAAFAFTAVILHVFNHSIFKGLLFLGAGSVHFAAKTKNIEKLGGLIKKMPYTAVFFLVGSLAVSAIPPFNGFVSEWIIYQSLFTSLGIVDNWVKLIIILTVAILAMAGAFAAYSFVKLFGISFLAKPRSKHAEDTCEVPRTMLTGMGLLSVLCLLIGVFPLILIKIIDKLNFDVLNIKIISNISGISSFILLPLKLNNSSVSTFGVILISAVIVSLLYFLIKIMNKNTATRTYGTWDCGYIELNSRMEYTATAFSKPIRIVLRSIFKPQRELQVEEGVSPYFFNSAKYVVSTESIFEKYLYDPLIKKIVNFARRTRLAIQTGSVHKYLIYMFIVLIVMFVYYAVSMRLGW
jgi:hydrogenase-4 component B